MSDLTELTAFQRDLLYVIAGNDGADGQTIQDELESYYESELHHGRVYPNLDDLAEDGLIEKGEHPDHGLKNQYHLTESGATALANRRSWTSEQSAEAVETVAATASSD